MNNNGTLLKLSYLRTQEFPHNTNLFGTKIARLLSCQCTLTSTGPVRISIVGVTRPDPLGRMDISFTTSRPDTNCICRTNVSNIACSDGIFPVDPFILGAGTHSVSIVCMDSEGYSITQKLKVILSHPPPASEFVPALDGGRREHVHDGPLDYTLICH